jgi:hypothetical protein
MHTRAAVAVFDAEASNKIVTGKVTSDRSMSRPFPTAAYWYEGFDVMPSALLCTAVVGAGVLSSTVFSVQGAEQRTQARRARLPATTCQRSDSGWGVGFNEQIFGADEQVSAGLVQKMTLHE